MSSKRESRGVRKTGRSRARAHQGRGRDHEHDHRVQPGSADRALGGAAGKSPALLRVNLTKIGSHNRFFITGADGETIITSRLYPGPKEAKKGLIDLVMAIQADDFETFDHT